MPGSFLWVSRRPYLSLIQPSLSQSDVRPARAVQRTIGSHEKQPFRKVGFGLRHTYVPRCRPGTTYCWSAVSQMTCLLSGVYIQASGVYDTQALSLITKFPYQINHRVSRSQPLMLSTISLQNLLNFQLSANHA